MTASAIVGAADESTIGTDNPKGYDKEDYVKLDDIGSGSYGIVSKIQERKTGRVYALKTQKSSYHVYVKNEINALKQLDHENIVKMITNNLEARSEYDPVHIVLEYMPYDLDAALNHPEI
ncbi:MAG: CMGC/CDK protein kinase, partial [Amphiamblys sp. WSBS2006]